MTKAPNRINNIYIKQHNINKYYNSISIKSNNTKFNMENARQTLDHLKTNVQWTIIYK